VRVRNTPLVSLKRMSGRSNNSLLAKLADDNPADSVKDRWLSTSVFPI